MRLSPNPGNLSMGMMENFSVVLVPNIDFRYTMSAPSYDSGHSPTELQHTVTETGIKLAGRVWGVSPDTAQVRILALHGWLDNGATYDLFAPRILDIFKAAGHTEVCFVALDLAGHGKSSHRPPEVLYYLWDYIDDVLGFADEALGWDTFQLIGHSMGGHISLMFSAAYPDRIEKLTLLESVGPIGVPNEDHTSHLRDYITRRRAILSTGPSRKPTYNSIDDAAHTRGSRGITPLSDEAARILCSRGLEPVKMPTARRPSLGLAGALTAAASTEGTKYSWSTDVKLMLRPPFRWSTEAIASYVEVTPPLFHYMFNMSCLWQIFDSIPKFGSKPFPRQDRRIQEGGGPHGHWRASSTCERIW
ncbi:alpha/beta-hydrolase [Gonapodya prolifera JEL478]|uniref:Alpha/beta-hydrolase n=1 Tax=Gonapodya prolifera (strain JEL478) TaxID=1344416 RepID=A0A139AUU6_GONPJ|nr:alpha/beta-hydrolase [Gonapodya prolifera JEL478]|eukprot:KXS20516.1 alpha/beta-hydrolase [Gonapodya prolifera JEL478]